MKTQNQRITLITKKQFEMVDITQQVRETVKAAHIQSGQVLIYNPHTTAAIRINHNESLLMQDMMKALYRLVPVDISYSHDLFEVRQQVSVNERSNGHAHVKAFLLGSSESLIIDQGEIVLGAKQSIFFVDLDGGRPRDYYISVIGEKA